MDRNFTRIIVLFWVILCSGQLSAQDIHFSQFYDSPINLNPAMAGHVEGKYRVNLINRSQWNTYSTFSASFDINFGKPTQGNSWGLSGIVSNDRTSGGLSTLEALLGGAYHFNIDGREMNYLSIGGQAGFVQKRIRLNDLTFGSQFDPSYTSPTDGSPFNQGIPLSFGLDNTDVIYPDARVGITWATYLDGFDFRLGGAYMHLMGGEEGFIRSSELPARIAVHADAKAKLGNHLFIRPHVLYMTQAQASQLNFGTHIGYSLSDKTAAYVGASMRSNDSIIAIVGVEVWGLRIGLARDFTNAPVGNAFGGFNPFELAISYTGAAANRAKPYLPAIRFFD